MSDDLFDLSGMRVREAVEDKQTVASKDIKPIRETKEKVVESSERTNLKMKLIMFRGMFNDQIFDMIPKLTALNKMTLKDMQILFDDAKRLMGASKNKGSYKTGLVTVAGVLEGTLKQSGIDITGFAETLHNDSTLSNLLKEIEIEYMDQPWIGPEISLLSQCGLALYSVYNKNLSIKQSEGTSPNNPLRMPQITSLDNSNNRLRDIIQQRSLDIENDYDEQPSISEDVDVLEDKLSDLLTT